MMRYSKLIWNHSSATEPVEIFSEHDDQGRELRKVEHFSDGSVGFASSTLRSGTTRLSLIECPPDDEVNLPPEIQVADIPKSEFENIWRAARQRETVS